LVFGGAVAVVLIYSLRGGGSYDLVAFEEHGLLVWWVLAIGFALGILPRRRPSLPVLLLWGALAAYAGWTALSLLWTQSSELTTTELARALDYLGLVVLAGSVLTRDSWRAAAAGLGFGALLVCVIALGSRLAPSVFGADHVARALRSDRLSYPFGYWNAVAAWGVMSVALALVWSAHDHSRVRRGVALGLVPVAGAVTYLSYSRAGAFVAGLAVIIVLAVSRNRFTALIHTVVAAAGTGLIILTIRAHGPIAHGTGTRGGGAVVGVLALACAGAALAALLTRTASVDAWRMPRGLARGLATVVALIVIVLATAVGPRLASRGWHSFTHTTPISSATNPTARLSSLAGSRYAIWKSAISAFDHHPGDGTGAGTFEFWWNQRATDLEFVRDAHNIWLENMAELGIPGLLLIVAVAVAAIGLALATRVRAHRSQTAGAAAAFLAVVLVYLLHATVDWMWESTAVTVLALAGVAVVGARLTAGRRRLPFPARVALVVVAAVAAVAQLPGILSTNDVRNSQAAERAGNASGALHAARDAVSAEPWSAGAHEQEALVLEAAGQLPQAKRQESLAISDEPSEYTHYLIRSRIETELRELGRAVRDYSRAYQLRPNALVFALEPYFKTR
jgi:O-Antigen ligase